MWAEGEASQGMFGRKVMKFRLQNYNEFNHFRWHDYFSIVINEFPVVLVRKYEWYEDNRYAFVVQVFGFEVYQRIGDL
jgi:hypothetical protein